MHVNVNKVSPHIIAETVFLGEFPFQINRFLTKTKLFT